MSVAGKCIFIFTNSYPFTATGEYTFIEPELQYLRQMFDKIVIIPSNIKDKQRKVDDDILIECDYANLQGINNVDRKIKLLYHGLTSFLFYKEIAAHPSFILKIKYLKRCLGYIGKAMFTKKWVLKYIKDRKVDLKNTVFYSYWLDATTLGISLTKSQFPQMKVISRAHRIDLYEYANDPPYIPLRQLTLELLDRLYVISEDGKRYIEAKYQQYNKTLVAKLGVKDSGYETIPTHDGVLSIVSCSFLVPVKRVDLLIRGIAKMAKRIPDVRIYWNHFGSGPLEKELKELAISLLPSNVVHVFHGHLLNHEILEFYRKHQIDVFINVSKSEGIPVSIMEAQSFAIPVIATNVGGNREIVSDLNGMLLPENPSDDEVAEALSNVYFNKKAWILKKQYSKENWRENYNADRNFHQFAINVANMIVDWKKKKQF